MNTLVEAARRHKGVRFRHRGRTASGLDCAGMVWLAYHQCGVTLPDVRTYGREPHDDGLISHITVALGDPVELAPVAMTDLRVGDVIVIRFEVDPHHVALVTDYPLGGLAMLHADGHTGRVIEHRLAPDHVERITHVFRRPL